jgi:hypothetical protein
MAQSENTVSAANFGGHGAGTDRSPGGLQYQRATIGWKARGSNLGQGLRVAPAPDQLFSQPLSGGQFGGGHAKSMVSFGGDQEPEGE